MLVLEVNQPSQCPTYKMRIVQPDPPTFEPMWNQVWVCTFSRIVASLSTYKTILASSENEIYLIQKFWPQQGAMPLQSKLVVGLNNGSVEIFDLSTSDLISSLEVHSKGVKTMTTWNDEKILVRLASRLEQALGSRSWQNLKPTMNRAKFRLE